MAQQISVLGIDIAKLVFHVVGMDDTGRVVLRKRLARGELLPHRGDGAPRGAAAARPVDGWSGRRATFCRGSCPLKARTC
jgi:hypothetical protein